MTSHFGKYLPLLAVALIALPLAARAAQSFDGKAFGDAQAAGKSILVEVTAPWCPTCAKQKPIIDGLEADKPRLMVFNIDFDSAKDLLKRFGVQYQSTLIVFNELVELYLRPGPPRAWPPMPSPGG